MAFFLNRRRARGDMENHIPRGFRPRIDPLREFTNREFKKRYRIPKQSVLHLARTLRNQGFRGPLHGRAESRTLSAVLTVCTGIRFLATGSMYRDVGDSHHIARSSVCRAVRKTINLLTNVMEDYVSFPVTQADLNGKADEFADIAGMPGVIGAVDGTHVGVRPPADEERAFRNRKGTYSINAQVICDANLEILDVDAKWAGATHDSYVWRHSFIGESLQIVDFIQPFYLLGDSGYPLRPWLLTPYLHPQTPAQEGFNQAQRSTRNTVERAIGLLKIRFRCLDKTGGVLQSPPGTASEIICSCVVLHNIAIRTRMPLEINNEDDDDGLANENVRRIVNGEAPVQRNNDFLPNLEMNDPNAEDRQLNRLGQRIRNAVADDNF